METNNNQSPQYNYNYTGPQIGNPQVVNPQMVNPQTGNPQMGNVVQMQPMIRGNAEHFKKYGLLSVVFGLIYGFCLYNNHSSITYPLFMACALVILKLIRARDGLSLIADCNGKRALGIFYVVSLMLLSIHRCLTTSMALYVLERLAIFLLFFSYVIYLYVDTTDFDIGAWMLSILITLIKPLEHLGSPFSDYAALKRSRASEEVSQKKKNVNAVLLGLAITIPLLLVIIPLLASADAVFENMLDNLFKDIDIPEYLFHTVMMIVTAIVGFWCAYTIITSMVKQEIKIRVRGEGKTNPVIAITFTSVIGLVYIFFCAIQLLFLFSGKMALPEGYTYAEYAHEGFYQLLAVCILNIVMVSICQAFFKSSKVLKALLTIIAACTYIMIVSSAYRMIMYIDVYHLTFLRLFVLWFLAVLCFWLSFLIISMYVRKFPVFKACMVAITLAFIAFIYSNPDYQIARYDLQAAANKIDEYTSVADYIEDELSFDAVPAIVQDKEVLELFRRYHDHEYITEEFEGFRRFNVSYYIAQKYLKTE